MEKKVVNIGSNRESTDEVPDIYINSVKFLVSQYEFLFIFGLKTEPEKEPKPIINIRMSPEHAKVMSKLLSKNVRSYEKQVGEIKLAGKLVEELKLDQEDD